MGRRARIAAKRSFSTAVQKGKRVEVSESRLLATGTAAATHPALGPVPARRNRGAAPVAGPHPSETAELWSGVSRQEAVSRKDQNKSRRVVAQSAEDRYKFTSEGKSKCDCLVWFLKLLIKENFSADMRSVDSFEKN